MKNVKNVTFTWSVKPCIYDPSYVLSFVLINFLLLGIFIKFVDGLAEYLLIVVETSFFANGDVCKYEHELDWGELQSCDQNGHLENQVDQHHPSIGMTRGPTAGMLILKRRCIYLESHYIVYNPCKLW